MCPIPNQKRDFRFYRYIITHDDNPQFKCYCISHTDVKEKVGIPRSALYQLLKGESNWKHRHYRVERCRIDSRAFSKL